MGRSREALGRRSSLGWEVEEELESFFDKLEKNGGKATEEIRDISDLFLCFSAL